MASVALTCPHCRHVQHTALAPPPGTSMRCSNCGKPFAARPTPPALPRRPTAAPHNDAWSPAAVLGPDAEEYADFERASQPRAVLFTARAAANLLLGVLVLATVAAVTFAAVLLYNANLPQNLIVGSWRAMDHPTVKSLEFNKLGQVRVVADDIGSHILAYRFSGRNTIEIYPLGAAAHEAHGTQFRVRINGDRMTLEDREMPETLHLQRVR
jgi:hypothetical protein